jgi:hypothetical protein
MSHTPADEISTSLFSKKIDIPGFQDVVDHGSNAVPLFVTSQAAFTQDDEAWVESHSPVT